jgi:hypothetical protein
VAVEYQRWLDERDDPFNAVVLVPTGPKPYIRGLFETALAYGARHAAPIFVQSIGTDEDRPSQYHQFPNYLGQDDVLASLALRFMSRMSFETVEMLLSSGSLDLSVYSALAERMREAIRDPRREHDVMRCLRLCVTALATDDEFAASPFDRIKIAHHAGEFAVRLRGGHQSKYRSALGRVRNLLAVNHGGHSIDEALAEIGRSYHHGGKNPFLDGFGRPIALSRLIELAIGRQKSDGGDELSRDFLALRGALIDLSVS